MKNIRFTLAALLLLFSTALFAQLPQTEILYSIGGNDVRMHGAAITLDSDGNIYQTGFIQGTGKSIDLDPGPLVYSVTVKGYKDAFITKTDRNGKLLWVKIVNGNTSDNRPLCITLDKDNNILITGNFVGTTDFDPGFGIFNQATNSSYDDIFILKLDGAGNFIWAKHLGVIGSDDGSGNIITDPSGSVYISGSFYYTIDVDPNAGVYNLTTNGQGASFLLKLNANGSFAWAGKMGSVTSMKLDDSGNLVLSGLYLGYIDFDPGSGTTNSPYAYNYQSFISKITATGNLLWVKILNASYENGVNQIALDPQGNICATGFFSGTVDFDPSSGVFNMTTSTNNNTDTDVFVWKLDGNGNFLWAKRIGNEYYDKGFTIMTDAEGNSYSTGHVDNYVPLDLDPGAGVANVSGVSLYLLKLDASGNYVWGTGLYNSGFNDDGIKYSCIDKEGNLIIMHDFSNDADVYPLDGIKELTVHTNATDMFIMKLRQKGVTGQVFNDINKNCVQESGEAGLAFRRVLLSPGDQLVETNVNGRWSSSSLTPGTYNILPDTNFKWQLSCAQPQSFTFSDPNVISNAPAAGLSTALPCSDPTVSIAAPNLRPCFSKQKIFVKACNQLLATSNLNNAYADVALDPLISLQSASLTYSSLGNNVYRFQLGTITPQQCVSFTINAQVSCDAVVGQTLCMETQLYPLEACAIDQTAKPYPTGTNACNTSYDNSNLSISGRCVNDSIYFSIQNKGTGNMSCYAPVRLYLDTKLIKLDSVQLNSNQTLTFGYAGDGRTWRMEVSQHPLYPGLSFPSASVERCSASSVNWIPNLITTRALDDQMLSKDIYCGTVTSSYDPNDKIGYPLGVTEEHAILPNGEMKYIIRFQNTGTDTAFTVIVRDTLDSDLDVLSLQSGVGSHPYSFRLTGPRVAEWTFSSILLPNSAVNEAASHGFITFTVKQIHQLTDGTTIKNKAGIYFDFNTPIVTNQTLHTINTSITDKDWTTQESLAATVCSSYTLNGFKYSTTGNYFQKVETTPGNYKIVQLNLTVNGAHAQVTSDRIVLHASSSSNTTYQWVDCAQNHAVIDGATQQTYTPVANGQYAVIMTNGFCPDTSTCIDFTIPDQDISVQSHSAPASACALTTAESVSVLIKNNAIVSIPDHTVKVSYQLDGGTVTEQLIAVSLSPGATLNFTFDTQADLSACGAHTMKVWVSHEGDTTTTNNTAQWNVQNDCPIVTGTLTGGYTGCESSNSGTLELVGYANGHIAMWETSFNSGLNWYTLNRTTSTINITNLNSTLLFRVVLLNGLCPEARSNTATVTIEPATVGGSLSGSATYTAGTSASGDITLSGNTQPVDFWESSTDAGQSWTTINNTTNALHYTDVTENTWYRARTTAGIVCPAAYSNNATLTFQQVTGVSTGMQQLADVQLFPNPVVNTFEITANVLTNNPVTIEILNNIGHVVLQETSLPASGVLHQTIDVVNLPSGIYLVRIQNESFQTIQKLIKK